MEGNILYRVECCCSECGELLMGSQSKPHMTRKELSKRRSGLVMSAPINAPKCPKCKYSTGPDYNAGVSFLIDDGIIKLSSQDFFK